MSIYLTSNNFRIPSSFQYNYEFFLGEKFKVYFFGHEQE